MTYPFGSRVCVLFLSMVLFACGDDDGPPSDDGGEGDASVGDSDTEDSEVDGATDADEPDGHTDGETPDTGAPDGDVPDAADAGEPLELGEPCDRGGVCASGFCVDGVCCDFACDGICEACVGDTTGQGDGTCAPVAAGDPADECAVNGCFTGECAGDRAECGVATAGTICRDLDGDCDVAEICDGESPRCPANSFIDMLTVCRPSAGVCDVAERCDGRSPVCPSDVRAASTTICRPVATPCDANDYCDGVTAECPSDAPAINGTTCRPSVGSCDVAEQCDGVSFTCAADQLMPAESLCRPSTGDCDVAEECTGGSPLCPADGFRDNETTCRASAGPCDVAEHCTGSSASCPTNAFSPSTATACIPYACTGTSAACETSCTTHAQCATGAMCIASLCVPAKRMFVSSTTSNGNLGGLAGADARCQALATSAGLTGTYKAWLSDSTTSAASRLAHFTGPYFRVGTPTNFLVATSWSDLIDSTTVAIATDETGEVRGNQNVWTGTSGSGLSINPNCTDWTASTSVTQGRAGHSSSATTTWTSLSTLGCETLARIYCVEQ